MTITYPSRNVVQSTQTTADLEPTSALKQAASDMGINYGDEMAEFIEWAYGQMGL